MIKNSMFKLTWNNPESGTIEYSNKKNIKTGFNIHNGKYFLIDLETEYNQKYAKYLVNKFLKRTNDNIVTVKDTIILREPDNYIIGNNYDFQQGQNIYGINTNSVVCNGKPLNESCRGTCIEKFRAVCIDEYQNYPYAKFQVIQIL